jgi:thermolysin
MALLFITGLFSSTLAAQKIITHPLLKTPYAIEGQFAYPQNMSQVDAATAFLQQQLQSTVGAINEKRYTFTPIKTLRDPLKKNHIIRFKQSYDNIPIFNSDIGVHISDQNIIGYSTGKLYPVLLNTHPKITSQEALKTTQKDLEKTSKNGSLSLNELSIYENETTCFLTWHIVLNTTTPLGQWHYFVDAQTGEILSKYNNIKTELHRNTYVIPTPNSFIIDFPGNLALSDDETTTNLTIQTPHNHLKTTYDYFFNTFGRDSFDNHGATINQSINYPVVNAFWTGEQLVFGKGDGTDFGNFGDSLDIVAHEYAHAVTQYTADLIYEKQSGALNESMSDFWGAMVERNNWKIGEDVYTPGLSGDALRYMDTPSLGFQPEEMKDYVITPYDNGGVHTNSGIPNKAAYLIATALGLEATEQIYYRALTTYFTSSTDFWGARIGLEKAAVDLFGENSTHEHTISSVFDSLGITSSTAETSAKTLEIQRLLNGPNPFNPNSGGTSIEYILSQPAKVEFHIYAINGEKIWKKVVEENEDGGKIGFNKVTWDGSSDFGERIANGMYILYIVASNSGHTTQKKLKIGVARR